MKKRWFNSMLSKGKGKFENRCWLSKSMESLGPIKNTSVSKEPIRNDKDKNLHSSSDSNSSSYSNLADVRDIHNFISDDTFFVKDSNRDIYSIYFDIENKILELDNDRSFRSELESSFDIFCNSRSRNNGCDDPDSGRYMYDTKSSWNNHIHNFLDSYLHSQICSDSHILSSSDNYSASYIYNFIWSEGENSSESESSNIQSSTNGSDFTISESSTSESSNDLDVTQKYRHLWVQCENCYGLNYKKFLKSKIYICEQCGYHLKMNSPDRIDLLVDPGTWDPMDDDMVSIDPIEFHSEEEPYKNRIDSYQRKTGLTEAVQTGTGQLNGLPIAIGVMDFQFMGGSMGSVVGEKITRLIEYAANKFLPLLLVCASGGARMQEGSLSLMQMAKISSALYDYQSNKKLFYVAILTSPTTGGVTASFGMLGDIIIAEPNAYIAFAGKRVIEQTLNKTVPEGSQVAEYLFHKGLFDLIVPRNPLKGVLNELFLLHGFFPLNQNELQ
uniref:Acetyl-coenzyme A carboxylase carboxyl transferase subunit beta, chloroplastic n=1 Tax=Haplophyllum tragacanthoides TaxID=3230264 RepID=A0AAU7ZZ17_9ROSI